MSQSLDIACPDKLREIIRAELLFRIVVLLAKAAIYDLVFLTIPDYSHFAGLPRSDFTIFKVEEVAKGGLGSRVARVFYDSSGL